ncbi:OmpA family protein [Ferruginivarius sediminum]|nr:OmpA family protein [Ferruginivarius sediminum]
MQVLKSLGVVLATTLLAACAGQNIDAVKSVQPTGSAFTRAATDEYREIAAYEADEMYDWRDADYFARKGLRSAEGEVVAPEQLGDWDLPEDKVDELASARNRLVGVLDKNARREYPKLAARAQARFDCWVEQQEENHQPDHIARCRDGFYAAISEIEEAMKPAPQVTEPAPEPEPEPMMEPERYTVYFNFDAAAVRPGEAPKIDEAVRLAMESPELSFSVTGHADRAGPAEYNRELSLQRAQNVREALVAQGIDRDRISIAARGESEPAVATPDGVREQANRRVEIVVQ